MPRIMISLLLAVVLFGPFVVHAANLPTSVMVSHIYDGDTFKSRGGVKIRLIGIDAPEREASGRDRFYLRQGIEAETLRKISKAALEFVIRYAKGKRVTLSYGPETHDQHGRLLAYVYLPDGRLLNGMLVEQGLAAVFRKFPFGKKEVFLRLEREARLSGAGMWQSLPAESRK